MNTSVISTICDYPDEQLYSRVLTNRMNARTLDAGCCMSRTSPLPNLPASWGKVDMLDDNLDHHEIAIWVDADAVIWNPITYERLDHELGGADMAFAHDENGINAGVWIIRRAARSFLSDVLRLASKYANHRWWEQGAIHALNPCHAVLDSKIWNCKPHQFEPVRGMVCHFAGIENRWYAVKKMYAEANGRMLRLG